VPGLECFVIVAVIRGVGSALVHALCSGIAGYFLARRVLEGAPRSSAVGAVCCSLRCSTRLWNGTGLLLGFVFLGVAGLVFRTLLRRALARSPHHGRQIFPHAPEGWFQQVPRPPV
jgi:protease PrsW